MNGKHYLCLMVYFLLYSTANAQVIGTVRDQKGKALPGVQVIIQDLAPVGTTDEYGNFSVDAPSGSTLLFQAVGFELQAVYVTETMTRLTIEMKAEANPNEIDPRLRHFKQNEIYTPVIVNQFNRQYVNKVGGSATGAAWSLSVG